MEINAKKTATKILAQSKPKRKPRTLTPEIKAKLELFAKTQYLNYVANIKNHLETNNDIGLAEYLKGMQRDMAMGIVRHAFEYDSKSKTYTVLLYVGMGNQLPDFKWTITAFKLRKHFEPKKLIH